MKNQKQAVPSADAPAGGKNDAGAKSASETKPDQGLSERRKAIRTLPVPDAVESERDTDWALFQSLSDSQTAPDK